MKIAVDGYELVGQATGVGRVISDLLPRLVALVPEHEFSLYTRESWPGFSGPNLRQTVLPRSGGYLRWQNGPFYRALKELVPDILIATNYTMPILGRWRSLLLEYDVSFAAHPEWFTRMDAFKRTFLTRRSLKRANRIITISEFSKGEILRIFSIPPDKITVIPLGIGEGFRRESRKDIQEWRAKKGIEGKKVVGFLGSIFNRRNIPLLVEAVDLLRRENPDLFLYVIGKDLSCPPQAIPSLLDKDWILWEESIGGREISLYYSSLDCFAYLSDYEGFGLPPMEALACGAVPVLLDKTALREVYAGLAVFVRDKNAPGAADALRSVLEDENLRTEILDRFAAQRDRFSLDRYARRFASVLEELT
jgi:glycosyltransferase involved in cell wall biosynthesis